MMAGSLTDEWPYGIHMNMYMFIQIPKINFYWNTQTRLDLQLELEIKNFISKKNIEDSLKSNENYWKLMFQSNE